MRNQNQIDHSLIAIENDHNQEIFEIDSSIVRGINNTETLDSNLISDQDNNNSISGNFFNIEFKATL